MKDFEEKVKILDLVVIDAIFMANLENHLKNRKNGI